MYYQQNDNNPNTFDDIKLEKLPQKPPEDILFQKHLKEANDMMYYDLLCAYGTNNAYNLFREGVQQPLYEDLNTVYNVYKNGGSNWKDCIPFLSPLYSYSFGTLLLGIKTNKTRSFDLWKLPDGTIIEPAFDRMKRELLCKGVILAYKLQGAYCTISMDPVVSD